MNDLSVLYRVVERLAFLKYPVVFKGALILRFVLSQGGVTFTSRLTRDIDMNWVGQRVSINELEHAIKEALKGVNLGNAVLVCTRIPDSTTSAGFALKENSTQRARTLFSFDISLSDNPFYTVYRTPNGVEFMGATINKMYADKMHSVSHKTVLRRTKDVYDLYVMSFLEGYSISLINAVLRYSNRTVGKFIEYITRVNDIVYAYDKMTGVQAKPGFESVYGRVRDFCFPYITEAYKAGDACWNNKSGMWVQTSCF